MRRLILIVLSSMIFLSACAGSKATPTPSPTLIPTPTLAPTPSPSPTASPADEGWTVLAPKGAGFTSKFPGEPKLTKKTQKTDVGNTPSSEWMYLVSNDLAYSVVAVNYPKGSMTGVAPNVIYDGGVKGMTGSTSGLTVKSQGPVNLGGHPGRYFTLTGATASIKGQMFIVRDNLFMVYGTYGAAITDFTGVDKFIADFQLT